MRVDGTGFLSEEGIAQAQQVAERLAPILELVENVVCLCHQGMAEAAIRDQETPQEKQRIIACVVLARLLEITEGSIALARGGFSVQVVSATREFLEAYFLFGNVCKDPAFVPQYFNSDLKTRQTLINQAFKHQGVPFASTHQYATDEVKAELQAQIDSVGAAGLDAYRNAKNVGCTVLYDSLYRITSAATHSSPRALGNYVTEVDGMVIAIARGPQLGDIAQRLLDQGALLLNVRSAFDELFVRLPTVELEPLRRAFEEIALPE